MSQNYKGVVRVLWITFFLNVIVVVFKIIFGLMINSLSMVADGFHSLADSLSNIVCLFGLRMSARPADKSHPYGHKKFETLTTVVIAIFLMFTAYELFKGAIGRFSMPAAPNIDLVAFAVLVGTLAINIFVTWWENKKGEEYHSELLIADALHTRSDVYVTISVIFGFVFIKMGYPIVDPIIAMIIAFVIALSGFRIVKSTATVLSDSSVIEESELTSLASSMEGVTGVHKVRTRRLGDEIFVDLHIMVNPKMTVKKGHGIAKKLEAKVKSRYNEVTDITIHVDPTHKVIKP